MILRETMAFADVVHQVVDVRQATFWIDGYLYNSPEDAVIASTRPMIVDWCYSACMDLKMDIGLLASVRLQLPGELRQQILALRNMRRNRPV